jgi:drug/metabolite transporter (DMT)-like permease
VAVGFGSPEGADERRVPAMTDLSWGILGGLGCGLNWAVTSLVVRSLTGTFTPAGISAVRSTVGGAILIGAALAAGQARDMLTAPLWVVLSLWIAIVIAMALGDTLFFRSMDYLGVTRALTLSLLNPLLTTLTGTVFYGETMTLLRLVGIGLVIGGLCLIVSGKGGEGAAATRATRRGLALVCSAAAAWAVSATIQKPALLQIPVLAGSALRIPMAGLVLWLTPWTRGTLGALRSSTLRERRQLGTVCFLNAVGSGLFTVAIRYAGVAVGNVLASTSPLFALPLEVWLLKQRPSRRTVLGAVMAVTGIGCINL